MSRARGFVLALVAAALLGGCGDHGSLVVVTVDATVALPTASLLQATVTAGGRTRQFDIPLSPPGLPPSRSFGIDLPPSISGTVATTVTALDDAATVLASAHAELPITHGGRLDLPLDLNPGAAGDLGTDDASSPGFTLSTTLAMPFVRQGGSVMVPLSLFRVGGFTDAVTVSVTGLPSGVTAGALTIDAGQTGGMLALSAAASTTQGTSAVAVTGTNGSLTSTANLSLTVGGAAGTLDLTYAANGVAIVDNPTSRYDVCSLLALSPGDRAIVAGLSKDLTGAPSVSDLTASRLTTAGALDATWGTGGRRLYHDVDDEGLNAIAVQPDGKVILAGYATVTANNLDLLVARLNADGTTDTGFGTGGAFTRDMGGVNDAGYGIVVQSDGKIVVVGSQTPGATTGAAFAVRLTAAGALDATFGTGGVFAVPALGSGGYDRLAAAVRQADGRIIAVGTAKNGTNGDDAVVIRLTTAGALDSTFGSGGKVLVNGGAGASTPDDGLNAVALQADGSIVSAGYVSVTTGGTLNKNFGLFRFSSAGLLDSGFGSGGVASLDWFGQDDVAHGVAVQPDGKIVVSGEARHGVGSQDNGVVRFTTLGAPDPGFGTAGKADIDLNVGNYDGAFQVALQADGRIVVGGFINNPVSYDCTVIRLWQ